MSTTGVAGDRPSHPYKFIQTSLRLLFSNETARLAAMLF